MTDSIQQSLVAPPPPRVVLNASSSPPNSLAPSPVNPQETCSISISNIERDTSPTPESAAPSSPNSLSPPETSSGLVELSPQISRSKDSFAPQRSTRDTPETPAPKSHGGLTCPRTGSSISTSPDWISQGVPPGVRIYAHLPQDPHREISTKAIKGPAGVTAMLTSGPTYMIDDKPCMLIPAPLGEEPWRSTSLAIVARHKGRRKDTNQPEMQCRSGKTLTSLRDYSTTRTRSNSIARAVMKALPTATVGILTNPLGSVNVGRTWLCSLGCEGAITRKRDWALVELDPNQADATQRWNMVVINGEEKKLRPPTSKAAKPGTRVVLATMGSRTTALEGTLGGVQECVFGYAEVQKIVLDREGVLQNGDAGACVVDTRTGAYYGMLVMAGPLKKDKPAIESVAWFVPYQVINNDILGTFPLEEVEFGASDPEADMIEKKKRAERRATQNQE